MLRTVKYAPQVPLVKYSMTSMISLRKHVSYEYRSINSRLLAWRFRHIDYPWETRYATEFNVNKV